MLHRPHFICYLMSGDLQSIRHYELQSFTVDRTWQVPAVLSLSSPVTIDRNECHKITSDMPLRYISIRLPFKNSEVRPEICYNTPIPTF